ncbi:MAG: Holliday junction branch migration protein RuvA, partial [Burkholderiaceae bacterium]
YSEREASAEVQRLAEGVSVSDGIKQALQALAR